MADIKIFVEGVADVKFISDFVEASFGAVLAEQAVHNCMGWQNIDSIDSINAFKECKFKDITPIIIFDADNLEKQNGGVTNRKAEIVSRLKDKNIEIRESLVFLFPSNDNDGDLETLLEGIINEVNKPIFDCWEALEGCLNRKGEEMGKAFNIPAKKAKIHTYCTILLPDSNSGREKAKEAKRDYKNSDHWDLNHDSLKPLKDFLAQYFSKV